MAPAASGGVNGGPQETGLSFELEAMAWIRSKAEDEEGEACPFRAPLSLLQAAYDSRTSVWVSMGYCGTPPRQFGTATLTASQNR